MKDECNFRFSNFLTSVLYNYLANSWFEKTLFSIVDLSCLSTVSDQAHVTAPPEVLALEDFLPKNIETNKVGPR